MNPEPNQCPRCGEPNPLGVTLCWACYTPLTPTARREIEAEDRVAEQKRKRFRLVETASLTSFLGGVLLAIASGYLPRRRFAALGCGLLTSLVPFAFVAWEGVQTKRERQQTQTAQGVNEADIAPILRIANAMLIRGAKDGATRIRLRAGSSGVQVGYEVEGEWREQMQMEPGPWPDLKNHLRLATDDWKIPLQFRIADEVFCFAPQLEIDYPSETLVFTREEVASVAQ